MPSLKEELRRVIAEIGEIDAVERIQDNADLYKDLGLDSMQALEIVLEIEKRLALSIPEDALRKIRTLNDAVAVAKSLGARDGD
ncbi:MAG: acyl carrier protein [Deltaproteobacteria bacterium]|nr:acyl carrier protein [Deltaproteobacteria bacterium]